MSADKEDKECINVLNIEICVGDIVDASVGRHRVVGKIKEINKRYGVLVLSDGSRDVAVRITRIYMLSKLS